MMAIGAEPYDGHKEVTRSDVSTVRHDPIDYRVGTQIDAFSVDPICELIERHGPPVSRSASSNR